MRGDRGLAGCEPPVGGSSSLNKRATREWRIAVPGGVAARKRPIAVPGGLTAHGAEIIVPEGTILGIERPSRRPRSRFGPFFDAIG